MTSPGPLFWAVAAFAFGVSIGSFLNVVVWRLPRGQSLISPPHSYCPKCNVELAAIDLVPLISFLALRARCRRCKAPISWRYFGVELLTGMLFVALSVRYAPNVYDAVAMMLFAAVMVPIYFIDLATFEIQISLTLAAYAIPVVRDLFGIVQHDPRHALLWGWLPRSIAGGAVGVAAFGIVRILGWIWKRVEAMGLGDVLLARAMGAMLISIVTAGQEPLRLFPIWFMLSIASGLVVGPFLILARVIAARRKPPREQIEGGADEELAEEPGSLVGQVGDIVWCLFLGDLVDYVRSLLHPVSSPQPLPLEIEAPAPTAIPFGPFMVLGFFGAAFGGEYLTAWYLNTMMRTAYEQAMKVTP